MSALVLAAATYREGIRKKTLVAFLMFGMLTLGSSMFLTVFSPGEEIKIVKDVCLSTITFFGMLITVFVSGAMIPAEMENRVFYTIISKPMRRSTYIGGKFLGAQCLILINLALMTLLFLIVLWAQSRRFSTGSESAQFTPDAFFVTAQVVGKAMVLVYCEMAILSALTVAASTSATSPTLPVIFGIFVWLVGHLVDHLKNIGALAGQNESIRIVADAVYWTLPNLNYFYLRDNLIHNDPYVPPNGMLPLILYAAQYVFVGLVLAYILFRRKEV